MTCLLLKRTAFARPVFAISSLILLSSATSSLAQETYNWSGVYFGATAGASETTSDGNIVYGSGSYAGWEDGYFEGEIYDDVEDAELEVYYYDGEENYGWDYADVDLGDLDQWITEFDASDMVWNGTVFAGVQQQFGALVIGGEFRATLGSVETTDSWEWRDGTSDYDSASCYYYSCGVDTYDMPYEDGNWETGYNYLDGNTIDGDDYAWLTGELDQSNGIGFSASFDTSFSAVARAGIAADRVMFYGVAGASIARVTATTGAYVYEEGEIEAGYNSEISPGLHYEGDALYQWYGENTEDLVGYVAGLGLEYAMTDNIILRGEATYTDYGTISVTGVSNDTDATYTVSQKLTQLQVQTGVLLKF